MEKLNFFRLLINRLYYFFFVERFAGKVFFDFPKNIYRWDLIQFLINKYKFQNYFGYDKNNLFQK